MPDGASFVISVIVQHSVDDCNSVTLYRDPEPTFRVFLSKLPKSLILSILPVEHPGLRAPSVCVAEALLSSPLPVTALALHFQVLVCLFIGGVPYDCKAHHHAVVGFAIPTRSVEEPRVRVFEGSFRLLHGYAPTVGKQSARASTSSSRPSSSKYPQSISEASYQSQLSTPPASRASSFIRSRSRSIRSSR
ncbi:hypothetical protein [Pseudomonas phage PA10]|uniref:Uncharacterized protein n=1 Tax=Pseudomonas phage PA10 TaxID=1913575 RepID=A0A1J0MIR3_9CAUD|nr:hypothetical protein FDH20_gp011 [Pseudomonas phage PA10]APD20810.1 hypothetical protein [Pseudomonas phage PA10]